MAATAAATSSGSSLFPIIDSIEQVRSAIAGCAFFTEATKEDEIVFNYRFGHCDAFPDPFGPGLTPQERENYMIRRECRGLVFQKSSGTVIARGFHKFFNVNELDETDQDRLDFSTPHIILQKLDGVPICALISKGHLMFGGKTGSGGKLAKAAENTARTCQERGWRYFDLCQHFVSAGYTPLFEFCSPTKKLVVQYTEDQLTLTAIRHRRTGEYMQFSEMATAAREYNVPCVTTYTPSTEPSATNESLIRELVSKEEIEGFVIRFSTGAMYKVKTLWYLKTGRGNSDLVFQERDVWSMVLSGKLDDHKAAVMQQSLRARLDKFSSQLFRNAAVTAQKLADVAEKRKAGLPPQHTLNETENTIVDQIMQGNDPLDSVVSAVKAQIGTKSGIDKVRFLVGDLYFLLGLP
ncbi:RNA ligase, T4 RnlA family protein [Pelomyxa schiedti]|nr:RNA ligase, T4 RnlA family protein [Pelomyxa schiedti]